MAERILPAQGHQLAGMSIAFDFGIGLAAGLDPNHTFRQYAEFATNPLYGQNQNLDPQFYPISYFPLNPWREPLPRQRQLATIEDPGTSFGTLTRADTDDHYVLRLFNASDAEASAGSLGLGPGLAVTATTNLTDEDRAAADRLPADLGPGELINLVIGREKGDS